VFQIDKAKEGRRKKKRMTKDISTLLSPDEFGKILKDQMGEEFYTELKKEMKIAEDEVLALYIKCEKNLNEDHQRLKLYRKGVRFGLELFVSGVGAEESNPIYKTFKEFNASVDLIIETLNHRFINRNNPTPQELAFIFGIGFTLCSEILEKFKNDADWESKTWNDITPKDVREASEKLVKQFKHLNEVFGIENINTNVTIH
jgi:hypothetical protein